MKKSKQTRLEITAAFILAAMILIVFCDKFSGKIYMELLGIMFSAAVVILAALDIHRRKNSHREVLLRCVVDRLEDYFPRIARVDYGTGKVEFLRDKENEDGDLFTQYDWNEFREVFLGTIHPEEGEKCKNFFSLENIRRIREQKLESATCTYRRQYMGDYLWMQAIIIPMQHKGFEKSALIYARNVDDSVRAEELHKNKLWELVQQARSAENEKAEYLKYLSEDLKTPIDAVVGLNEMARKALEKGDTEEAMLCLNTVNNLGKFLEAALNDIVQLGVLQGRRVSSRKKPFSLQDILEGYRMYYVNEMQGVEESFRICCGEGVAAEYVEDQARLIQVLNALLTPLYRYNKGESITLEVTLAEHTESGDVLQFTGKGGNGTASAEYRSAVRAVFPVALGTGTADEEQTPSPAEMALNSMMGRVSMEEGLDSNQFSLQVKLEQVERTV